MFQTRLEKTSLRQQNDYYIQHFNNLKTNIDSVNAIEHDLNKHFLTLKTLIEGNEDQRALQYISQYNAQSSVKKLISNTGNLLIDSIVNYKLENIIEDEISLNIDLNIPPVLNVADYDLTIILGNLIDNAISAMENIDGSNMVLKINWEKGLFFIHMENTFDGNMDIKNKKIVTTKKDKDAHGYGLANVSKAIEKYDGILNIQTEDNVFIVDVLMYTD